MLRNIILIVFCSCSFLTVRNEFSWKIRGIKIILFHYRRKFTLRQLRQMSAEMDHRRELIPAIAARRHKLSTRQSWKIASGGLGVINPRLERASAGRWMDLKWVWIIIWATQKFMNYFCVVRVWVRHEHNKGSHKWRGESATLSAGCHQIFRKLTWLDSCRDCWS